MMLIKRLHLEIPPWLSTVATIFITSALALVRAATALKRARSITPAQQGAAGKYSHDPLFIYFSTSRQNRTGWIVSECYTDGRLMTVFCVTTNVLPFHW
jgi:hypothetical protein